MFSLLFFQPKKKKIIDFFSECKLSTFFSTQDLEKKFVFLL